MACFGLLAELSSKFDLNGAAAFLKSTESQEVLSRIRHIVATGAYRLNQFPNEDAGNILFAAIMLGGGTLELFKDSL